MTTQEKIGMLAEALRNANTDALSANTKEDGGTCNLDCVMIDFSGWRVKDIQQIAMQSNIGIGNKSTHWMWKGYCTVYIASYGQGNNRTRMVEAACRSLNESLKPLGMSAAVYYQMD